jgi:hypothetical protein
MNVEEQLHFDGREILMVHDVFRREFAPSPTCLPTPAPSSGNWPRRRSRRTPGASMAHPPHRAVPSFKE